MPQAWKLKVQRLPVISTLWYRSAVSGGNKQTNRSAAHVHFIELISECNNKLGLVGRFLEFYVLATSTGILESVETCDKCTLMVTS